jgi:hypothetical protein
MKAMTNSRVRVLSSTPLTHREDTLRSIGGNEHKLGSRVEFLAIEGKKMADLIKQAPGDASSRLDWLHRQLSGT